MESLKQSKFNEVESTEKEINFSEKLSEYLNSENFEKNILELDQDQRQTAIGSVIEYLILHKDQFQLDDFWKDLKDIKKEIWNDSRFGDNFHEILIKSIAQKLGLKNPMSHEDEEKACDYVTRNLILNGYYFHGFNGVFEDSIKENGLSPNKRDWDINELRDITEIGARHNNEMLLGWHSLNSEDQLFLDHHANNLYRYANASPEWFAQFVAESHWIKDTGKDNKKAFYRRDYNVAKENVVALSKGMKLDNEENDKVINFFEKYWSIFANEKSKPKAALVKTTVFQNKEDIEKIYSYESMSKFLSEGPKLNIEEKPNRTIDFLISFALLGNDQRTKETIKPEDILVINLPEYNKIYPL